MGNVSCCPPPAPLEEPRVLASRHVGSRRTVAARAACAGWHPIATAAEDVLQSIRLVNAGSLCQLPVPWPRSQDLSEDHFLEPECDTLVLAVSHGWMYQAHPDPTGAKGAAVKALLAEVSKAHSPSGHTLCFFDFCSVPQRAFRADQDQRTEEEKRRFDCALRCMPNVYLLADAVLHVDMGSPDLVEETLVQVDGKELQDASLQQLGPHVQVLRSASPHVQLFDIVATCDGLAGLSAEEVAHKVAAAKGRACPVELRRQPFGVHNKTPVGERGWIYLERFVTMVKAAMVDESEFERVCFSNSLKIKEQIRAGSALLRQAAQEGEERIKRELGIFYSELDRMHFSGASTDKILGTAGEPNQNDRDVVRRIMREMVLELPSLWSEEQQRQRQRRLLMAVNGSDAEVADSLLRARADVNYPGRAGETCLHRAALHDSVEVARVLLRHGADVWLQDERGNCAAHNIFLMMSSHIVEFMELLAPDVTILKLRNSRQISPLERFHLWAITAEEDNKPFAPAMAYLERIWAEHPSLRRGPPAPRNVVKACSSGRPTVHSVHTVKVCGHEVPVDEWAPKSGEAALHVVVLTFAGAVPPEFMVMAWQEIARELRSGLRIKVFAVNRIGNLWRGTSLAELQDRLVQVLELLPLHEKFVLVDDARGFSSRMLLKMRRRLLGILMINPYFCVSEEYLRSPGAARSMKGFRDFLDRPMDAESIAPLVANMSSWDAEGVEMNRPRILKALEKEGPEYFEGARQMFRFIATDWAPAMAELHQHGLTLPFRIPMVLVGSAFAPEAMVHQSILRLHHLFPQSSVEYIPNSRMMYCLEGEEQFDTVLRALEGLLVKVNVSI